MFSKLGNERAATSFEMVAWPSEGKKAKVSFDQEKGNSWFLAKVSLKSVTKNFKITLKANPTSSMTLAVDNIKVSKGSCKSSKSSIKKEVTF